VYVAPLSLAGIRNPTQKADIFAALSLRRHMRVSQAR
jgi:hypothetical protein